jgi:hypothetical protein
MYQVGPQNIPLCLDCYFKYSQITQQQIENHERMANHAADEMAAVIGMPPIGPRFPPRPRPVILQGVKLNNIKVSNSVVGTINTGSIGTVDQSISVLQQAGEPGVAEALKALSEAVLRSGDITANQRNALIETLSVLAREAASPKETRQNTVAVSLIERASKVTELANDVADVCAKYWPVLLATFSAVTGT